MLALATEACMSECDRQILLMGALAFAVFLVLLASSWRAW